jgi:1-acyl-sn-glycerol-3-phosphate acyltransferase
MIAVRSILFNFLFYFVWSPLVTLACAPSLLFHRSYASRVAAMYQYGAYLLAKYIIGLDFELRGAEHRPDNNTAYIVASKHQSAYETLLLYQLFDDPTIILKKELLSLPVFGWFLQKVGVIAIDRGNRAVAMHSLYEGAKRMKEDKRPIIIYPQGTRVKPDVPSSEKPYKNGYLKLYTEVGLPILPVAINTGLYWPRNSFWKYPGKAIIEFLPVIPPGLSSEEVGKRVEEQIEFASQKLAEEGRNAQR